MNPMRLVALPTAHGDLIELICLHGHRSSHSLARVTRLNDGWCGKCGADISYQPLAGAGKPS